MDATYAEVGAEVVIFHRPEQYIMDARRFAGIKTTIILKHPGANVCHVQVDGGHYWWPIQDMILASDIDLLQPEQKAWVR